VLALLIFFSVTMMLLILLGYQEMLYEETNGVLAISKMVIIICDNCWYCSRNEAVP
jgi:hypothetical protein